MRDVMDYAMDDFKPVLSTLKRTTKNRTGGKIEEEKEKKETKYTQ